VTRAVGGAARPRLAAIACGWLMWWAAAPESRALARSVAKVSYGRAEVWATAVRLLRVNSNLPIREKDEGAGYVLFDFLDGGRSYRASLELVATGGGAEGGGEAETTEVVVSIPELPRRFEAQLLDRLAAKLRDERGPPPQRRARPAPDGNPGGNGTPGPGEADGSRDAGLPRMPRAEGQP
jgi:hypothetical protein